MHCLRIQHNRHVGRIKLWGNVFDGYNLSNWTLPKIAFWNILHQKYHIRKWHVLMPWPTWLFIWTSSYYKFKSYKHKYECLARFSSQAFFFSIFILCVPASDILSYAQCSLWVSPFLLCTDFPTNVDKCCYIMLLNDLTMPHLVIC